MQTCLLDPAALGSVLISQRHKLIQIALVPVDYLQDAKQEAKRVAATWMDGEPEDTEERKWVLPKYLRDPAEIEGTCSETKTSGARD